MTRIGGRQFQKKTVRNMLLKNKRVLLRADYNVPLKADGSIVDDYRIKQSVETINYLIEQNCKIVIISHMGRPKDKNDKHLSLEPVAKRLSELLHREVLFATDCIGETVEKTAKKLKKKQILLLENVRFYPEEEANDAAFAKQLAGLADVFVQDGFGVVHRAHASTAGITAYLPSVAGLLLEREVSTILGVMHNPQRPLAAIIGGAKIADKIDVLEKLIDAADFVAVGGAMANTFLLAEGIETGKSLVEPEEVPIAKDIIEKARAKSAKQQFTFYLPQDGVVASKIDPSAHTRIVDWDAHVIATVENYPKQPPREASRIKADERILDIGPFSGAFIAGGLQLAQTVIWNGTMGITEVEPVNGQGPVGPFAHGTDTVIDAILGEYGHRPYSVVGGGDTVAYIQERGLIDHFDHVSTGGGATLELMAGKKLPGVEALQDE
ncbi:phosphoglycerate kinase [Candidatus Saccharibacteria bacterium]|nr:phosphoglycerate kinase [Candidatus Saccharibacteria bacterium]